MSDLTRPDVEPDAQPEDYRESDDNLRPMASCQTSQENQETDEVQMLCKIKSLDVSSEKKIASSQSDFYDDDYTQRNDWFPPNLKEKLNIAIIHADEDKDEADNMGEFIEKNVHLMIGGKLFRPRVDLLENVTYSMRDDGLDIALNEADYLFVYVTTNFDHSAWSKYQSRSSVKAIVEGGKHCSLICVHTDQSSGDNLPAKLKEAKRLDYYPGKQEKFIKKIIKFFSKISHKLLADREEFTNNRKVYWEKHYSPSRSVNQESCSTKTRKFSQESTGKQTSPADDGAPGTGAVGYSAVGYSASKKPINPRPHYPKDKKFSQNTSRNC